jgi:Uma2 family endonuclease
MVFQAPSKPITFDEFIAYVSQPENKERNFEFVDGEIIEKMPGSTGNSGIASNIGIETAIYCRQNNIPYFVTGEAGAYRIGDNTLVPDFAYKTTSLSKEYPDPVPPLWVVKVISSNDKVKDIRKKRLHYLEAGILLWEVYPDEQIIDVYAPNQHLVTYGIQDTIEVTVIAGLKIEVAKLFRVES